MAPDHSVGHGVPECATTVRAATMTPETVRYMDVPAECCGAIAQLCELPPCPLRDAGVRASAEGARGVREIRIPGEDFTVGEGGRILPLCVPFLMPAS